VASELAHHFEAGSDWQRAIHYLQLVADVAGKRYAHRQATAILQHALSLASRLPDTERVQIEIEILLKLASIYLVSLDSRAVETYEVLSSRAAHYGLFDIELRALIEMAIPLARISTARSLDVIERALRLSAEHDDPLIRARARASCLARRAWIGGWNPGDGEDYRAALAEIRRGDDRAVLGQHLLEYGFIQSISSEYREAKHSLVESLGILAESGEENPYLSQAHWQRQNTLPRILLFLGEWGEALREIRAAVAMVQKNEDAIRAQTLRVFEASVHLHALDFVGVLAICEEALPWLDHPWSAAWRRFCLAMCGAAETALGNRSRGLQHLSTAIDEMKSQPVIHDWYCRIMLQSSLAELWLDKGDLAQARAAAARFLNLALATAEHTWQTLAWEMNARVAMADRDVDYAQKCIGNALSIAESFEVPLADWRAHATAAELYDRIGKPGPSHQHRRLSASGILRLANSLDPDEPLRKAFLSASAVRPLLASEPLVSEAMH